MHFDWTSSRRHCSSAAEIFHFRLVRIHSNARNVINCLFSKERIAKSHGSQCGFCTPGMVMSMYTLLRNNSLPTPKEIENAFQGNYKACKKPQVKLSYRLDLSFLASTRKSQRKTNKAKTIQRRIS